MRKLKSNFKKKNPPAFLTAMGPILFFGTYKEYGCIVTKTQENILISLSKPSGSIILSDEEIKEVLRNANVSEDCAYETWEIVSPIGSHTTRYFKCITSKLV